VTQTRPKDIHWHEGTLSRNQRFRALGNRGATVWFTGLPASGKSTVAAAVEHLLVQGRVHAYRLDGDNVRHGLNSDLGFTPEDRRENIRRIGEVARLFADSGAVALVAFISPYRADRAHARDVHRRAGLPFLEVYMSTPIEVCEQRDPKGQYKRAREGLLPSFTGVDAPYEAPQDPQLVLDATELSVADCAQAVLGLLAQNELLPAAIGG